MKQWKYAAWIGILFVLVTGTLSHFLYEWTGKNFIAGFISPVNESVWEHMKLIFFPMFAFSLIMIYRFKDTMPDTACALSIGTLTGTLLIPALFYAYTFIAGKDLFFMDIAIFIISTLSGFWIASKIIKSHPPRAVCLLSCLFVLLLLPCFFLFSYAPPDLALFADPAIA